MDFVEICNVCARKAIIEAAKRIINSDWVCRSYSDLNFGVTFLEHSVCVVQINFNGRIQTVLTFSSEVFDEPRFLKATLHLEPPVHFTSHITVSIRSFNGEQFDYAPATEGVGGIKR